MDANKTAIDYVPTKVEMDIPAILRLKPAEPQARDGAMRIKLQTAPRMAPVTDVATEAECRAYQKMMGVALSGDASARADPELLAQIPRLKETLTALDSEMKSGASSDIEKRMAVHSRILELQGAQLTEVQKTMQKTVSSMGQMLQHQKLHAQLHEAAGRKVLKAEEATLDLHANMERLKKQAGLHSALHEETAEGVMRLSKAMQQVEDLSGLHSALHQETGGKVLKLSTAMKQVEKEASLHNALHKETAEGVLKLSTAMKQVKKEASMHNALHKETAEGVLKAKKDHADLDKKVGVLQKKQTLYDSIHKETASQVIDMQANVSGIQRNVDALRSDGALHSKIHLQVGNSLKDLETQLNALQGQSAELSRSKTISSKNDKNTKRNIQNESVPVTANIMSTKSYASYVSEPTSDLDVRKMRSDLDAVLARNTELEKKMQMHDQMHVSTTNVVRGLGLKIADVAKEAVSQSSLQNGQSMLALLEADLASAKVRGRKTTNGRAGI